MSSDILDEVWKAARGACDLCGITPTSNMRVHAEHVARIAILNERACHPELLGLGRWKLGTRVTKIKGSAWTGPIVGYYSTKLTPVGYCIESENEPGSVQIFPAAAIRALQEQKP